MQAADDYCLAAAAAAEAKSFDVESHSEGWIVAVQIVDSIAGEWSVAFGVAVPAVGCRRP